MTKCSNILPGGKHCGGEVDEDGDCMRCGAHYNLSAIASGSTGSVITAGKDSTLRSRSSHLSKLGRGKTSSALLGFVPDRSIKKTNSSILRRRAVGGGIIEVQTPPARDHKSLVDTTYAERAMAARQCSKGHSLVLRKPDGSFRDSGVCPKCGEKFSFAEPMPILPGTKIGQFNLWGKVAEGGCGIIVGAWDEDVGRPVLGKGLINRNNARLRTVAMSEKKRLAGLSDPSLVQIVGFKEVHGEPWIFMEWLIGDTIEGLLEKNGGPFDVAKAVAFTLGMCVPVSRIHTEGLLNPDIKNANFFYTSDGRIVMIDAGSWIGVNDDDEVDVPASAGYAPPEVDQDPEIANPSFQSDIYSVARCALIMCAGPQFDYMGAYRWTVPEDLPVLQRYPDFKAWILWALDSDPARRPASIDEWAQQGHGILRSVHAVDTGISAPLPSTFFDGETSPRTELSWLALPGLKVDQSDSARGEVEAALKSGHSPAELETVLQQALKAHPKAREPRVRLAELAIDTGDYGKAQHLLLALAKEDPDDWRPAYLLGRMSLAQKDYAKGVEYLNLSQLCGEAGARLAYGVACELTGDYPTAITAYDLVTLVEAGNFPSAALGHARCLLREGNRTGAVKALKRIPSGSIAHVPAEMAAVRALTGDIPSLPNREELLQAAAILAGIKSETKEWYALKADLHTAACKGLGDGTVGEDTAILLFDVPLRAWDQAFAAKLALMKASAHAEEEADDLHDRATKDFPQGSYACAEGLALAAASLLAAAAQTKPWYLFEAMFYRSALAALANRTCQKDERVNLGEAVLTTKSLKLALEAVLMRASLQSDTDDEALTLLEAAIAARPFTLV